MSSFADFINDPDNLERESVMLSCMSIAQREQQKIIRVYDDIMFDELVGGLKDES
tara:strand:- start:3445 stop:3609 length:165 start_codon:yes stop_codon:yes gene_type:complete